jgi:LPS-assembly protein
LAQAAGALCVVAALPAAAQVTPICAPDTLPLITVSPEVAAMDPASRPIDLIADQVERSEGGPIVLKGHAEVMQGRKSITGQEIRYTEDTGQLEASGDVVLRTDSGGRFETDRLEYHIETAIGQTGATRFEVSDPARQSGNSVAVRARGEADRIFMEGEGLMRLDNAVYSTCKRGRDDVMVYADELTLDQATGVGVAKNIKVEFFDVPIFYAPRMSFPITDERKSGFLTPSFGSEENSGFVLATPYYWNIAPTRDATITPKYYADRGLMMEGEFRYLDPKYRGSIRGAFLPNDSAYEDEEDNDRGAFTFKHSQSFSQKVSGDLDIQWVSDDQYYDDFVNRLGIYATTHLPQRATVRYAGVPWFVTAEALVYQTIDEDIPASSEPPDRLPRIRFFSNFPYTPNSLRYGMEGELVTFDHETQVSGTRVDLTPYVSYPLTKIWGFVTPKLSLRHTSYFGLENNPSSEESGLSRSVGIFSVDSGLFFERETSWLKRPFTQTLEPRAYYVYATRENQDELPVFDTGLLDLNNFGNFFRDNRFVGADRVEDANRITLAVTSRMIETSSGREWMRGSIGQIYFFEDREVGITDDRGTSDIIAEGRARLSDDWFLQGVWQWDTEDESTRQRRADIVYQPDPYRRASLSYRYSRDSTEQIDVRLGWPIAARWRVDGRFLYDIRNEESLEDFLGIEYNACCWAFRVGSQRRVDRLEGYRSAILFQLELTGLTTLNTGL